MRLAFEQYKPKPLMKARRFYFFVFMIFCLVAGWFWDQHQTGMSFGSAVICVGALMMAFVDYLNNDH